MTANTSSPECGNSLPAVLLCRMKRLWNVRFENYGKKLEYRQIESILMDASGQDGQLMDFLIGAYYRQALICVERGQPEEATAVLEKGYQALASFEERHDDGDRHDFLYPIMPRKTKKEAAAQFLGFLRDERFACLRELPGFQMVQTGVGKIAKES